MKDRITCSDVKPIRDGLGLSRSELAKELGCSAQAVHTWESEPENSKRRIHPMFAVQLRKMRNSL